MNPKAMFQISYGLYVLTARSYGKDNGCIINTVAQVTSTPNRVMIAVNKNNYTHDIIRDTGFFNLSVLSESAPFSLFQRFGFQSGRNTDKFEGFSEFTRTQNTLAVLTKHLCAWLSCKVVTQVDLGTHTMFIADVTDCDVVSGENPVTYTYYQKNIKPKPAASDAKKKGFRCTVCGYIYEGETLPPDFICPICKHDASAFVPIG